MKDKTSISISPETKQNLDRLKLVPCETYESLFQRITNVTQNKSENTLQRIIENKIFRDGEIKSEE